MGARIAGGRGRLPGGAGGGPAFRLGRRRKDHRRRPEARAPQRPAGRRPLPDGPRGRTRSDRRGAQRRDGLPLALAPRAGGDRDAGGERRDGRGALPAG